MWDCHFHLGTPLASAVLPVGKACISHQRPALFGSSFVGVHNGTHVLTHCHESCWRTTNGKRPVTHGWYDNSYCIFGDRLNKYLAYPGRSSSMSHLDRWADWRSLPAPLNRTDTLPRLPLTQLRPTCGSLELIKQNLKWNHGMIWIHSYLCPREGIGVSSFNGWV